MDERGKVLGICSIRNILEARVDDLLGQLDGNGHKVVSKG